MYRKCKLYTGNEQIHFQLLAKKKDCNLTFFSLKCNFIHLCCFISSCDEVAVAGFGYDMSSPNAPLHYYENIKMSAIKESWTHNIQREKEFLRKLVKARVITDLTSGI